MDAPDHVEYRRITQSWFTRRSLHALQGRIRVVARDCLDRMAGRGGECEFCPRHRASVSSASDDEYFRAPERGCAARPRADGAILSKPKHLGRSRSGKARIASPGDAYRFYGLFQTAPQGPKEYSGRMLALGDCTSPGSTEFVFRNSRRLASCRSSRPPGIIRPPPPSRAACGHQANDRMNSRSLCRIAA